MYAEFNRANGDKSSIYINAHQVSTFEAYEWHWLSESGIGTNIKVAGEVITVTQTADVVKSRLLLAKSPQA